MNRKQLMETLDTVAPVMASKDVLPILTHLWFRNDRLMAFNDLVAISAPCPAGFAAAVPASFIELIRPHTWDEVELKFSPKDGRLRIKIANTVAEIGTLPEDNFIFNMPEPGEPLPVPMNELLEGIGLCLHSVSDDESNLQSTGITLIAEDNAIDLYSTNRYSMSHCRIPLQHPIEPLKVVLSEKFCRQLRRLEGNIKLEVRTGTDNYSFASTDQGVYLCGKLLQVERFLDFKRVISEHLPDGYEQQLVPVPPRLAVALKTAAVMHDATQEYTATKVSCQGEIMRFFTKTDLHGQVADKIRVPGHPDVEPNNLNCSLIEVGLKPYNKMLLTEKGMIMANGKGLYLVAASTQRT